MISIEAVEVPKGVHRLGVEPQQVVPDQAESADGSLQMRGRRFRQVSKGHSPVRSGYVRQAIKLILLRLFNPLHLACLASASTRSWSLACGFVNRGSRLFSVGFRIIHDVNRQRHFSDKLASPRRDGEFCTIRCFLVRVDVGRIRFGNHR
jgi:hypothetical protein